VYSAFIGRVIYGEDFPYNHSLQNPQRGYMQTIYSEHMFSCFEKELGPCADELGIPRSIFQRPDVEFSIEDYYRLLECAASTSDPHIGLSMGKTLRTSDLGAFGHAVEAAPTVGYALHLVERYIYVFAHANVVRLDVGKKIFVLGYNLTDSHLAIHQQDVELVLSLLAKTIRDVSGRQLNPTVVDFAHSRPGYHKQLQAHFGCEVRYDRSFNRLQYSAHVLEMQAQNPEPSLLQALEFYLADRLKLRSEDGDLLDKVNHLIATSLGGGVPEVEVIATTLGLSRRTLQRRLSEAGAVFSDMVDNVRREIAQDYVLHSDHSLTDIALMLGYQELSSFSRAFRRWTGISPQQQRDS
jgi:AraC-like DNA-binding protein